MKIAVSLLISVFFYLTHAQTKISGDISGLTLSSDNNPYIVSGDIIVTAGKSTSIKQGCILLFEPFTGLKVDGSLLVKGTSDAPVVFTSISNNIYNKKSTELPNAFDWNGIFISRQSSTVILENFRLEYSVYGLKSERENITVKNMIANSNGQFHFTINESIQMVQDGYPYSYSLTKETDSTGIESVPAEQRKPVFEWQTPTAMALGVFGLCSIGAGIFFKTKELSENELAASPAITKQQYDKHVRNGDTYFKQSITSYLISGVTIPAAVVIYLLKPDKKKVSLTVNPHNGFTLSIIF